MRLQKVSKPEGAHACETKSNWGLSRHQMRNNQLGLAVCVLAKFNDSVKQHMVFQIGKAVMHTAHPKSEF